jgi:hypothetical protein
MKNGLYNLVIAPESYPGKRYRNRYVYEHHIVFWEKYGLIPAGYVIHHKNGDHRDNRLSNLSLISHKEHSKLHGALKKTMYIELKCPICSNIFVREKRQTHLTKGGFCSCCSRRCSVILSNKFKRFTEEEKNKIKTSNVVRVYSS